MARIRSIKPEFWTSEQVVECSPTARLLFIGLWNFCDDGGNHPASAKSLKMQVLPGDNFTIAEIEVMVSELLAHGLMVEYEVEGKRYWHVTGWKHQKIEKPSYKHPPFDDAFIAGKSTTIQQPVAEHSPINRRTLGDGPPADVDVDVEGKGEDVEGKGKDSCADLLSPVTPPEASVVDLPSTGSHVVPIYQQQVNEFSAAYPAVDIVQQLRAMRAWLLANPKNRKTPSGMLRFVNAWLAKEQNRPRASPAKGNGKPNLHSGFDQNDYQQGATHGTDNLPAWMRED